MGSLHETNPSLWVETTRAADAYEPLGDAKVSVDVVVVGAGITGLSTALACAESGATVAVLEAGRVCSGATGYTTAKVTSQHGLTYAGLRSSRGEDVARAYAEANEAGLAQVASWVERYGIECGFERRPAYTYTTESSTLADVEAEAEAAGALGLPATFTTETDLPFDVLGAVRFDNQAQLHPRLYCLALASIIDSMPGCSVHERTRVVDVDSLDSGHVVLATHLPFLDRGGFFAKTHPVRSYAMAVRLGGGGAPMPTGMYLGKDAVTRSLRTAMDGEVLIVGGEGHKVGQEPDTRRCYESVETWARSWFDVASVEARWSAQDYVPVDGMPFVGRLLPRSDIFVATGFAKWGMTNGTAAGMMLADAIAGRPNPWLEAFDSTRLKGPLTSRAFYVENADSVGGHLVAERVRKPTAPTCRHLGCPLSLNVAEDTWDCPCHGSRYSASGEVLQGPTLADLELKGTSGTE